MLCGITIILGRICFETHHCLKLLQSENQNDTDKIAQRVRTESKI